MDITYEDLARCVEFAKEAQLLRESMACIRAQAEYGCMQGSVVSGTGNLLDDRVGEGAARLADLYAKWSGKMDAFAKHAVRLEQAIDKIENPTYRSILRLKYINGLSWEQISEKARYDERWCRRLHAKGLIVMGVRKKGSPKKPP